MKNRMHNTLLLMTVGLISFMLLHFIVDSSRLLEKIHYLTVSLPVIYLLICRKKISTTPLRLPNNNFNYFIIFILIFCTISLIHGLEQLLDSIEILSGLSLFALALFYLNSEYERGFRFILISFGLICTSLFFLASFKWIVAISESNSYLRIELYGAANNPVHASLLILFGISYLWLFIVEPNISRLKANITLQVSWIFFSSICIFTSLIFNSRSTFLATILMLTFCWLRVNRGWWFTALLLSSAMTIYYIPIIDIMTARGTSYRLEIWSDTLNQLASHCNLLTGCGTVEKYRPAGFRHPHSAYLSTLFFYGLPTLLSLIAFLYHLFWLGWKSSQRWLVLSVFGWSSVLTTSGGVLDTPQPLWIYVWLPTFMVLITHQSNFDSEPNQMTTHFL